MQTLNLQPDQHEHRRAPRVFMASMFCKETPVTLRVPALGVVQKACLHNLSRTGCFLKCAGALRVGSMLQIQFHLAGRMISAEGRIVNAVGSDHPFATPGVGVEFTRLLPADELTIESTVVEFYTVMGV